MAEIRGEKRGKEVKYASEGGEIIISFPVHYHIYDASGSASRHDILQTAGLPLVRDAVVFDGIPAIVTCKEKSAKQDEKNLKWWTVTCEFDNRPETVGRSVNENDNQDPTQWVQLVKIEYEQTEDVANIDNQGIEIVNAARRPYGAPLVRKRLIPTIPFLQYEPLTRNLDELLSWNETLNDSIYLGQPKGCWQLILSDADIGVIRGVQCWKIEGHIKYKKLTLDDPSRVLVFQSDRSLSPYTESTIGGWQPLVPQLDYVDINGSPIVDQKGNQFRGKIDGNGVALSDQSESPYYIYHEQFPYLSFDNILRLTTQP
jgi:hypothetical protein